MTGLVLGGVLQLSKPERFTSSADLVLVAATPGFEAGELRDTSIDSALQQLRSDQVMERAAFRSGYPGGAEALNADLVTRPVVNSRIVRLSVSAPEPDLASDAVGALVEGLLELRRESLAAETQRRKEAVGGRLAAVNSELERLNVLVVQDEAASATVTTLGGRFLIEQRGLLRGEQAALATLRPEAGYVARPPTQPRGGGRPGLAVTLASVLALSTVTGIAVGAVRDHMRPAPEFSPSPPEFSPSRGAGQPDPAPQGGQP